MKGNAEVGLFGVKLTRNDHLGQLLPTNRQSGFVNASPLIVGYRRSQVYLLEFCEVACRFGE